MFIKIRINNSLYKNGNDNPTLFIRSNQFIGFFTATVVTNRNTVDESEDNVNNPESVSVVKRGMAFGVSLLHLYWKIPKISPELIFVQRTFLVGLYFKRDYFSGDN